MKHKTLFLLYCAFFILTILVYLPTLTAPWQFDDLEHVLRRNTIVKQSIPDLLLATISINHEPKGTRALVYSTFVLNWKMSNSTPVFHLTNIFIHSVAAFLVVLLTRELLKPLSLDEKTRFYWSIIAGLIFLLHPVQTQAVAYITQRFESLSSLFYLATIYFFITRRYIFALFTCFLAFSSKETAMTLPVILIATDVYLGMSARNFKRRLVLYGLFFLLSVKILVQLFSDARYPGLLGQPGNFWGKISANTQVLERHRELTRKTYFLSQINIIPSYIRLLFIPYGQTIDHDRQITTSVFEWPTPLSTLFLLLILLVMLICYKKQRLLSLAIFFFFVTLSISSSIFPIDDLMNEHRLYLSMFGFSLFLVWLGIFLSKYTNSIFNSKRITLMIFIILITYGLLSFHRAIVWSSPLLLWEDAWKKSPDKARTNKNYGFLLTEAGRVEEGITRLKRAVLLNDNADYRRNLGLAYLKAQQYAEAEREFEIARGKNPDDARPYNDLGVALASQGKNQEAIAMFKQALERDPSMLEALIGVGGVSVLTHDYPTAEEYLRKAQALAPEDLKVDNNLAVLYLNQERYDEAQTILDKMARLDPQYPGLREKREVVRKRGKP